MSNKESIRRLLVRCPKLSRCSTVASVIVEAGILEVIRGDDILAIEVDRPYWHDYEWCWLKVCDFLTSPWDWLKLTPADFENREREVFAYCDEVEEWIGELIRINRDALEDIRQNFHVSSTRMVRRLPELWIIELRGHVK